MSRRIRVKVCGVTEPEEARQIALLGCDAIGLNFYPPSVRSIPPERAPAILRALPPFVEAVGVFVERPLDEITRLVEPLPRLRTVQWHGKTSPPMPEALPLLPAFAVRDEESLEQIRRYVSRCREARCLPAGVLVDAHSPDLHGGTGRKAPWHLLEGFDPGVPLILAGGLTPENVAEAVRRVRPYAVDVASGVESTPGRKDLGKVAGFLAAVRAAEEGLWATRDDGVGSG